jgi:hypothetical protein
VPAVEWAYLVSYDLNAFDAHNYMPFFEELQNSVDWWHFLSSTWIVIRRDLLADFARSLRAKMHSKDRLLILPAKGPADGWLTPDAWDWINGRLKDEWKRG